MRSSRSGFTLIEVLIATIVSAMGCLALIGGLAAAAALAGDGRRLGRSAEILTSRADRMRADVAAAGPVCAVAAGGSVVHPDGLIESWTAAPRGRVIDLLIEVRYTDARHRVVAESLFTAVACP
ncbi:MAG: type IV pilus modification PilV family protein [Gemmatimonadales bacterium]